MDKTNGFDDIELTMKNWEAEIEDNSYQTTVNSPLLQVYEDLRKKRENAQKRDPVSQVDFYRDEKKY